MPRKLGQHFLIRDATLVQLASAACNEHTARVIEIGPGRGALTRYLLPKTDELHAIEIDTSLASYLRATFLTEAKFHVHAQDVLSSDLTQWGAAVIIGNLPYYISSPLIHKFLGLDSRFPLAVFLLQWEVAQRLVASPGTRDYGFLTVCTQLVCHAELLMKVPPTAFRPPPKVESGAVRLTRKSLFPNGTSELLQFVSRCFRHKRKTLRNNLRPYYGPASDSLPEAGYRAEQLTIAQFIEIHQKLTGSAP